MTSELSAAERGFFERALAQAAESVGADYYGWVAVSGSLVRDGQTLANAAWGFYSGVSGRPWGVTDDLVSELQSERMRLAVEVGWALGLGVRAVRTLYLWARDRHLDREAEEMQASTPAGS